MDSLLLVDSLVVRYGETTAVDEVSLEVRPGEIVALLGPSGSGKSSLLRAVAGFEPPAGGDIVWAGSSIVDTPTYQRGFGLMFQDGQLFPHRDVAGNVAYGLRSLPRAKRHERVMDALRSVGMADYASRSVSSLSGGQAQRVALARSLAPRPKLLLLDEPLSALDRSLREHLSVEIRQILRECGASCVYVTHDQDEAFAVADRIGVMIDGHLAAMAAPHELWASPGRADVAEFLGFSPLMPAEGGLLRAVAPGAARVVGVLPEGASASEEASFVGVVVDARGGRGYALLHVQCGNVVFKARGDMSLGDVHELVGRHVEVAVDLSQCPLVPLAP